MEFPLLLAIRKVENGLGMQQSADLERDPIE
jgi:hypothetical protein